MEKHTIPNINDANDKQINEIFISFSMFFIFYNNLHCEIVKNMTIGDKINNYTQKR